MPEEKPASKVNSAVDQNVKTMAALAYIIFFIPLLTNKDSKFAMYHANQGLVLLLAAIVVNVAMTFISVITLGLGFLLWPLISVGILILAILGIMNAINGKMEPLPVIGGITLIK